MPPQKKNEVNVHQYSLDVCFCQLLFHIEAEMKRKHAIKLHVSLGRYHRAIDPRRKKVERWERKL